MCFLFGCAYLCLNLVLAGLDPVLFSSGNQLVGGLLGNLNTAFLTIALHARCCIHCITKELKPVNNETEDVRLVRPLDRSMKQNASRHLPCTLASKHSRCKKGVTSKQNDWEIPSEKSPMPPCMQVYRNNVPVTGPLWSPKRIVRLAVSSPNLSTKTCIMPDKAVMQSLANFVMITACSTCGCGSPVTAT